MTYLSPSSVPAATHSAVPVKTPRSLPAFSPLPLPSPMYPPVSWIRLSPSTGGPIGKASGSYADYLNSTTWKLKREQIIERAHGRCEACNSPCGSDVHHLTYVRIGAEELGDLQFLCRPCHKAAHPEKQQRAKRVKLIYSSIAQLAQRHLVGA